MNNSSIHIQGNIISGEILEKIRSGENNYYQQPIHFGSDNSVRDEISNAWINAKSLWNIFQTKRNRVKDSESGTTETRVSWMIPFLAELGYNVTKSTVFEHPETHKTFNISHKDEDLQNFPVHIVSFKQSLDKSTREGKISPHALVQEFLNFTEQNYAFVSNGIFLRLLRDSSRLVKTTYFEFNLEKMMEEDLFPDFALLYRTLHASRFIYKDDLPERSVFEYYHLQSLESGARLRENLSVAVINALVGYPNGIEQKKGQFFDSQLGLANGLLQNPHNESLREAIRTERVSAKDLYTQLLRLIYRFLFLIVTEERDLIYPELKNEQQLRFKRIYYRYYSIDRLRQLAGKRTYMDESKDDLWENLKATFLLFENEFYGSKLGIQSLASGLFAADAIDHLLSLRLDNKTLINTIRGLCYFINPVSGNTVRVNYSDLDVEEFGSVYEGLLEFEPYIQANGQSFYFGFKAGSDRGNSGSHYTPEELCKPLITNSLEHKIREQIEKAGIKPEDSLEKNSPEKRQAAIRNLLELKICDIACGSGHILLSAARRLATNVARLATCEEQPNPVAMRQAMRLVIKNCIYGVDYNPLAVELCKVALWLESHNPGEPLNFLDHHIKCGNSVVGLTHQDDLYRGIADEAFKKLEKDDKEIVSLYKKANKQERIAKDQLGLWERSVESNIQELLNEFENFAQMPERTPEEIAQKSRKYNILTNKASFQRIKTLADIQIAQFFIPKTNEHKNSLVTNGRYFAYLRGESIMPFVGAATLLLSHDKKFFHWFLEFPEIFAHGGFDCILGNPPFLGGQKISGKYGTDFLEYIKYEFAPIGAVDFVAYFFRRAFSLIKTGGFQSLISTNTIAQGSTREGGLQVICNTGGTINHAVRSMKWPGDAAVDISLITLYKGKWNKPIVLNEKKVNQITTYLDDSEVMENPYPLRQNAGKSFVGSYVLGLGFVVTKEQAAALIAKDPRNREVLFPYLNGDDLNNNPDQSPSRWVINFFDWPEEKARTYPDCFEIVERLVKPERLQKNDKVGREKWWLFLRLRKEMYKTISKVDQVMVVCRHTKMFAPTFLPTGIIYSEATNIFVLDTYSAFIQLSSTFHEIWAWKYSSTMGASTLRYSASKAFETYPFLQEKLSERLGQEFYILRQNIMKRLGIGITELYNMFHNPQIFTEDVLKMRSLQVEIDKLILASYGWEDIQLDHDFYEMSYLPGTDNIRFTISPFIADIVLKRLLKLNFKVHIQEIN